MRFSQQCFSVLQSNCATKSLTGTFDELEPEVEYQVTSFYTVNLNSGKSGKSDEQTVIILTTKGKAKLL